MDAAGPWAMGGLGAIGGFGAFGDRAKEAHQFDDGLATSLKGLDDGGGGVDRPRLGYRGGAACGGGMEAAAPQPGTYDCPSSALFNTLPEWLANAFDDGETTTPASDLRAENRSDGASASGSGSSNGAEAAGSAWAGSDDEGAPIPAAAHVPAPPSAPPPPPPPKAAAARTPTRGPAQQPPSPPAAAPPAEEQRTPGRGAAQSSPWEAASPEEEAARQLVDLDPAEGKRRGGELLSMLSENPGGGPADAAPPPARMLGYRAGSSPMPVTVMSNAFGGRCGPLSTGLSTTMAPGAPGGGLGGCAHPAAAMVDRRPPPKSRRPLHMVAVREAARRIFGPVGADVSATASGGYAVWLYGPALTAAAAAAAGSGATDGEEARWAVQQAALDAMCRMLWPILGAEAVYSEWRCAGADEPSAVGVGTDATRMGSRAALGLGSGDASLRDPRRRGPPRLTIWCMSEDEEFDDICWDFARRGACPRGGRCQWLHQPPPTYPLDLEVFFS